MLVTDFCGNVSLHDISQNLNNEELKSKLEKANQRKWSVIILLEAKLHQHLNIYYFFPHFSIVSHHYLFFRGLEKALESADCHQLLQKKPHSSAGLLDHSKCRRMASCCKWGFLLPDKQHIKAGVTGLTSGHFQSTAVCEQGEHCLGLVTFPMIAQGNLANPEASSFAVSRQNTKSKETLYVSANLFFHLPLVQYPINLSKKNVSNVQWKYFSIA